MIGNVIGFDPDTSAGAITGRDGNHYDFAAADWHGQTRPRHGDLVDFVVDGERAGQIYPIEPEYVEPSFGRFYFSPSGRVSRSQYWLRYVVPVVVIQIVLHLGQFIDHRAFDILGTLFTLAVLWPGIAVLIKRIHDRNKSGWLVWALYAPFILALVVTIVAIATAFAGSTASASVSGFIAAALWAVTVVVGVWFLVEFGCLRGTFGANQYGPDQVPH